MSILDITIRQFLEFAVYALPGVLFWYFIFRFQNRKALPAELVRDTFFIGIFSVIPLFLYQYAYTHWVPELNTSYLSTILENKGIFISIVQLLVGFLSLGLFFVIVIGGFTIFYSLFTKESATNTLKALLSEPLNFSATFIIFLIVLIIDIGLRTFTNFHLPPGLLGTTFVLAMLEEYSKHLIVRLFDDHKIKSIANAIELSMIVALSFAFLENIIYFTNTPTDTAIHGVVIGRSIISMFGHVIFSAVFGYYYGISKFASAVQHVESVETHVPAFPQWIYKIFRFKTANTFKAQKIFEGLVFATLIHTVFNLCLEGGFFLGVIPILVGGGYLVYSMLTSEIVNREFSLIGSKEMPSEDFEKLVWKISVMKHMKEIKEQHPDGEK
jgi:RsiW-degrading membrane proteinase PrsW (M82 family)